MNPCVVGRTWICSFRILVAGFTKEPNVFNSKWATADSWTRVDALRIANDEEFVDCSACTTDRTTQPPRQPNRPCTETANRTTFSRAQSRHRQAAHFAVARLFGRATIRHWAISTNWGVYFPTAWPYASYSIWKRRLNQPPLYLRFLHFCLRLIMSNTASLQ